MQNALVPYGETVPAQVAEYVRGLIRADTSLTEAVLEVRAAEFVRQQIGMSHGNTEQVVASAMTLLRNEQVAAHGLLQAQHQQQMLQQQQQASSQLQTGLMNVAAASMSNITSVSSSLFQNVTTEVASIRGVAFTPNNFCCD